MLHLSQFKTLLLDNLLLHLLALAFLFTTCFLSCRGVLLLGAIEVPGLGLEAIELPGLVLPDLRESRILKNDPE